MQLETTISNVLCIVAQYKNWNYDVRLFYTYVCKYFIKSMFLLKYTFSPRSLSVKFDRVLPDPSRFKGKFRVKGEGLKVEG